MTQPDWLIIGIAATGFGLCYVLVPICKKLAEAIDFMDKPGGHKSHEEPTPLLGGMAIFLAFWFSIQVLIYQGLLQWGSQIRGILLGSLIILIMGLVDDMTGLTPLAKFFVQIGASILVVFHDVRVSLFLGESSLTIFITVVWIIGITNSFNLLDNMDGLTAGVAGICALVFSIIAFRQRDYETLLLSITMLGVLLAFLRFNFQPAEIFLGDAGSGFIGFYMACLSVSANYLENTQLQQLPVITPIIIFSVPIFDTASVIAIRLMEGRSVWDADNSHFSHRLVDLGLTERAAVLVIYLITFTVSILAVFLTRVVLEDALLLFIHAVAIFGIIMLLEYAAAGKNHSSTN